MNKIRLLLIICFSILHSDEMTSSCKDYKHIECLSYGWKFENDNHRDAFKNYTKVKELNTTNKITAQPILIVECSKNENNIYVHNLDKSFKDKKNQ